MGGPRQAAVVVVVAALVGLVVALLSSRLIEFQTFGPWGAVYGTLAFLAAFGLIVAGFGGRLQKRLGYLALAVAAGLLSLGSGLFIAGWRVSPWTVEGAWLWPLALCSGAVAVVATIRAARSNS